MTDKKKEKEVKLNPIPSLLKIAQLQAEKCELKEAEQTYLKVLARSKPLSDSKSTMEALAGLLRLSSEALDEDAIDQWNLELDSWIEAYPKQIPPMVWFCKGSVARYRNELLLAQRYFHRYLRTFKSFKNSPPLPSSKSEIESKIAQGWLMLATVLQQRECHQRALWLCQEILKRYSSKNYRGINGLTYLILGTLFERKKDYISAIQWFQKADVQFLGEHNWFYHLHALYGYARIARAQQNFAQADWYLDLIDQATTGPEFGRFRKEISLERSKLEKEAIDLYIDSRKGIVATRESGKLLLGKQYILLQILEALSEAHELKNRKNQNGLSKAEIIEKVWKETYQPKSHDSKLYYNINRLRKLIEPNIRKPQYLLNWKQGYRLAPGLRIQLIEDKEPKTSKVEAPAPVAKKKPVSIRY